MERHKIWFYTLVISALFVAIWLVFYIYRPRTSEAPVSMPLEPQVIKAPPLEGRHILSIEQALALTKLYPLSARAHYELGRVYHARRDFSKAILAFERSIALDPLVVPAYFGLVDCYMYSKPPAWQKAEQTLSKLLQVAYMVEHRAAAYTYLGNLYLDMHSHLRSDKLLDKAEHAYKECLSLLKADSSCAYGIGIVAARRGKWDAARFYFEKAVEWSRSGREKAKSLEALANVFAEKGEMKKAKELIEEAQRVYPNYPATLWVNPSKSESKQDLEGNRGRD